MADKVKGILLREEVFEALQALSDEQRGKLVLALIAEAGGCDAPELDPITRMAYLCILPGVKRAQDESFRRHSANIENGKKVLQDPEDYDARANLMWASSLSHNGLMQTGNEQRGDWACHQMEHELSGKYDVAHGAGLTAIWGTWARYVFMEDPERFAAFGEGVFGIKRTSDPARDAMQAIKAMESCFTSIHMPINLKELGVEPSEEELDELAEKASFFGKRTIGAFKILDKEDIRAIYAAARG